MDESLSIYVRYAGSGALILVNYANGSYRDLRFSIFMASPTGPAFTGFLPATAGIVKLGTRLPCPGDNPTVD